ncbi:MAG: class I SAM-dependent methyltransferase [Smithella sp.]|nr:class I SAM-dependent methyltransferase [Smithella sp.]
MLPLYCPSCKSKLVAVGNDSHCEKCSKTWVRRHGLISFVDNPDADGHLSGEKREEFFSNITHKTNKEIQDYLSSRQIKERGEYFNSFKNNKADCFSFLNVTHQDVILDAGCGLGSWTIPLAKQCKEVYALDPTLDRLRFLEIRKKNEKLENIILLHASLMNLPFREPCFDYVLMNEMPEYIGTRKEKADAKDRLSRRLEIIYKLLKEKGQIVMAGENKYGFDFLFTAGKRRYSYNDYRNMLAKAGFRDVEFYYVWPDYRDPKYIFAEKDRHIFKYFLKHFVKQTAGRFEYMFFQLAHKFGWEKQFVSNFIITGNK